MNAWLKIAPARWGVLIASVALFVGTLVVRQRGLLSGPNRDAERAMLEAEKLRLAPFGDGVILELRDELSRSRQRGHPDDAALPDGWLREELPSSETSALHIRYVRHGGGISWNELLAFVAQCEGRTGLVSLDIQSQGTTRQRSIARVEIVVPFTPGTTRRQAGATFPEASGADAPRKVGRGPSLRRPSAFTGRLRLPAPAPGPASASSRPDPPGSAAGIDPTCSPEPQPITL